MRPGTTCRRLRSLATRRSTDSRSVRRRCLIRSADPSCAAPRRHTALRRSPVAFDRDSTLKKGEKFLRQGRLDAAIGEYVRVVEEQPRDWNTANLLGDLYLRAGQTDRALGQYNRIADHLMREGFFPKASALYKKILKVKPDDEPTQLLLADISGKQGLLADAKGYLQAVGGRRRERGDRDGVADIALRLGDLDPDDYATRLESARTLEEMGRPDDA